VLTSDLHSLQFLNTFTDLFKRNVLTDVTLVGDDRKKIEAHKIVLCAGSSMFSDFLVNNAHSHPMIYLKGMKQQDLMCILEYLYYGETTISQHILKDFLTTAKELEIYGLEIENQNYSEEDNEDELERNEMTISRSPEEFPNMQSVFNCSKCEFSAVSGEALEKHLSILHPVLKQESISTIVYRKESSFDCHDCSFSGRSNDSLLQHRSNLHASNQQAIIYRKESSYERNFTEFSEEVHANSDSFSTHEDNSVDEENQMEIASIERSTTEKSQSSESVLIGCTYAPCNFQSKSFKAFQIHSKEKHHTLNPTGYYKCTECQKNYSDYLSLRKHQGIRHKTLGKLECDQCDFRTSRKDNLMSHIMKIHEKKGKFNCNLCEFYCMRPGKMKSHMEKRHDMITLHSD